MRDPKETEKITVCYSYLLRTDYFQYFETVFSVNGEPLHEIISHISAITWRDYVDFLHFNKEVNIIQSPLPQIKRTVPILFGSECWTNIKHNEYRLVVMKSKISDHVWNGDFLISIRYAIVTIVENLRRSTFDSMTINH